MAAIGFLERASSEGDRDRGRTLKATHVQWWVCWKQWPQLRSWSLQELSQRTPSTLGFRGPQHNSQRAWPLPCAAASEPSTPREPPRLLCSSVPSHCSFFPECHSSHGLAPTHSSSLGLMTPSPTCTPGQPGFWSSPTPTPPFLTFLRVRELVT